MWPLRIAAANLRPIGVASLTRVVLVATTLLLFLYADYALFRRLFRAIAEIEAATPFFALGLLRNLLAMVFLVAFVVLFSSSLTASIGAFFTDLDLDVYHAAPRSRVRVAVARWAKTLLQSATVVFAFLIPLVIAFAQQYRLPAWFVVLVAADLALLLTTPVSAASVAILFLVRWFPVRRVHQIVASLAVLVLTSAVIAFRMSRPERFFAVISTDDVRAVLEAIELPSMDLYPGTAIADLMVAFAQEESFVAVPSRIVVPAVVLFALFVAVARSSYFAAFVRARESMAPVAIGAVPVNRLVERLASPLRPQVRAMIVKEAKTLSRDVAQWSQLFLMAALLFIYLYNIRMLPLGGDARAAIVAYANLGMAGFVVAAICLRFAFPSISSEGKAFWLIQTSPASYRDVLRVKVGVYAAPLIVLSVILTTFANALLSAPPLIWAFTLPAAMLIALTLVALAVGMGGQNPNFAAENPLQVGLSLGGFAYMAISLGYVGLVMLLLARPIMRYFFWKVFGTRSDLFASVLPIVIAITVSLALCVFPLLSAERKLTRISEQ